jgi:hypothetical protein
VVAVVGGVLKLRGEPTAWAWIGYGLGMLTILLILVPITLNLEELREYTIRHQDELLTKLSDRLEQICMSLNEVTENQLISDRTKSVAFREKDRDTFRRAVQEEISKQDWEAALRLVNDLEAVFGYKAEADRFRAEINSKRHEVTERKIEEQLPMVERYVNAEAWGQAIQEAHRVMVLFPNEPRVQNLPAEIENRRQERKKKLLDSWHEAVNKHDVDGSIEILKHLDLYLTPAEAEGMQETARGVFKEKIGLLRSQFLTTVQEKRWAEALRLGDTIMTEFPNSRMAQEVKEMMEMLRQRAAEEPVAKV